MTSRFRQRSSHLGLSHAGVADSPLAADLPVVTPRNELEAKRIVARRVSPRGRMRFRLGWSPTLPARTHWSRDALPALEGRKTTAQWPQRIGNFDFNSGRRQQAIDVAKLTRGARSEIDFLNGEIVVLGWLLAFRRLGTLHRSGWLPNWGTGRVLGSIGPDRLVSLAQENG